MKKIVLSVMAMGLFTIAGFSQTATEAQPAKPATDAQAAKPAMTKQDKEKRKAQMEQELSETIKTLGLNADQEKQVREALDDASKKSSELKNNAALDEAAKMEQKKKINDEKNEKLKTAMGKDKFKQWSDIRKQQREKQMQSEGK
jgi:hypothetical protein